MSTAVFKPRGDQLADESNGATRNYLNAGFSAKSWLLTIDHKRIAILYLISITFFFFIGGLFAVLIRLELLTPQGDLMQSETYNKMFTMHGIVMIFLFLIPSIPAIFGNFLIPLMIGCDDMVFPRVNRLSYQIFLLSVVVLFASFFAPGGGFGGGWTAYPPLSAQSQYSLTPFGAPLWLLAIALEFVAFLLGGINFITTTMNARAKGMKMYDIPIIVWMIVIASLLFMLSVGPLIAGAVMLLFDQILYTTFYNPEGGGDPVLWQHLFWFFGHPEV
ncbi:MAG: cbb3-type cytochrome c oxidase subunit I, partial [Calditrichaeota bacterium]|nr:cbb3-type cytochrome c oxidase subunit I [Calditrichota bacterium]